MSSHTKKSMARNLWRSVFISLSLFIPAGCDRVRNSASHQDSSKRSTSTEQTDIVDDAGKKEVFEKMRTLWRKQKPAHYRVRFAFLCECSGRTTQLVEVVKDGKRSMEKGGEHLPVEVRDGKITNVLFENGEHVKIEAVRDRMRAPGLIEYQWHIGNNENEELKLIADPVEYLWFRAEGGIHEKTEKSIFITYDRKYGFIRKIKFMPSIPDTEFLGEIKDFTPLE